MRMVLPICGGRRRPAAAGSGHTTCDSRPSHRQGWQRRCQMGGRCKLTRDRPLPSDLWTSTIAVRPKDLEYGITGGAEPPCCARAASFSASCVCTGSVTRGTVQVGQWVRIDRWNKGLPPHLQGCDFSLQVIHLSQAVMECRHWSPWERKEGRVLRFSGVLGAEVERPAGPRRFRAPQPRRCPRARKALLDAFPERPASIPEPGRRSGALPALSAITRHSVFSKIGLLRRLRRRRLHCEAPSKQFACDQRCSRSAAALYHALFPHRSVDDMVASLRRHQSSRLEDVHLHRREDGQHARVRRARQVRPPELLQVRQAECLSNRGGCTSLPFSSALWRANVAL